MDISMRIVQGIREALSGFEEFMEINADTRYMHHHGEEITIFLSPYRNPVSSLWLVACGMICNICCKKNIGFLVNDCWDIGNNFFDVGIRPEELEKSLSFYRILTDSMGFHCTYLSSLPDLGADPVLLDRVARQSATRQLRCVYKTKGFWKAYEKWKAALAPCAGRLEGYAQANAYFPNLGSPNRLWISNGTWYDEKLLYDFAKKYSVPTVTTDVSGNRNSNVYDTQGIAIQMPDIHATYLAWKDSAAIQQIADEVKEILETRIAGKKDLWIKGINLQASEHRQYAHDYILLPNVEWGRPAAGTHIFYQDDEEWLEKTIRFLLENTSCSVAVRQHPASRMFNYISEPMGFFLEQFKSSTRFTLYSAFDEVNTYDIIAGARCVIVNTSTAGMECAYLDKRVVTESNSFYSESGFVTKCSTEADYFAELLREPAACTPVSEADKRKALAYYGLRARYSAIAPAFTTSFDSMNTWVKMKLRDIYADKETKLFLDGICANIRLPDIVLELRFGDAK